MSVSVYMSMYVHLCVYVRECMRVYIYVHVYLNQGIPNISLRRNLNRHLTFHCLLVFLSDQNMTTFELGGTHSSTVGLAVPANPKNLQIIFSKTNQDLQ